MAINDKIYLRDHHRLVSQLETRIPKRAFAGATLDVLYAGERFDQLDDATRAALLAFSRDFLSCGCAGAPFCGHPERAFMQYLLELRADGYTPNEIVDVMGGDYQLTAYPGDVLTFLDDAVRSLEAIESLATVEEAHTLRDRARSRRQSLLNGR